MTKTLARQWAEERGVSRRIRRHAYEWAEDYMNALLETDDAENYIYLSKQELKKLINEEENNEDRRLLKYELRFVRWFWEHYQKCCECHWRDTDLYS
jgi:hypothetical protein